MNNLPIVTTDRLKGYIPVIQFFKKYKGMFQDEKFIKCYGVQLSDEQIQSNFQALIDHWAIHGFGPYIWFDKKMNEFVGYGGLKIKIIETEPEIELAYSLVPQYWGFGLAEEIGKFTIDEGFKRNAIKEIICFTTVNNKQSIRVIEKLNFVFEKNFTYFNLPHCLYRLQNPLMNKMVQHNEKNYNAIAEIWAQARDWYIEKPAIDEAITYFKANGKILDIGCGSGKPIAEYLLHKGFDIYGLDISSKQLEHASKILAPDHLYCGDIRTYEFNEKFDGIICWFTLFHIHASEHLKLLNKIYKILNHEGILSITFADTSLKLDGANFKKIDEQTIVSKQFEHDFYHSGNPKHINSTLVEKAGFKIIRDYLDQPGNQVILAKKTSVT